MNKMHELKNSTLLSHIDHKDGCLYATFRSGGTTYKYDDVDPEHLTNILEAESPGKYMILNIIAKGIKGTKIND